MIRIVAIRLPLFSRSFALCHLEKWTTLAENHWTSSGENGWTTLGENTWTSLGENTWPALGENTWTSIARKMTVSGWYRAKDGRGILAEDIERAHAVQSPVDSLL